jgi:2,3-bisphosphoglycerate-dependent phosphoglycerate mutase
LSGKLLITRHGESEWNAKGIWTGHTDVHLSKRGFKEAEMLGKLIKNIPIDFAYCSQHIRALETLEGMLDSSEQIEVPFERSAAINERDYGDYTGKNKWQVKQEIGDEKFEELRRGWNNQVPNGESLKMVYERAVPFYKNVVLERLKKDQTVLMVAHGNSIRALIKYIESISVEDIDKVEMIFGKALVYTVDLEGRQTSKEVLKIDAVSAVD